MPLHRSTARGRSRPAPPSMTHAGVTERRLALHPRARLVLLLTALAACGGGELTLPSEGQPSAITVARGNRQSGTTGEPLSDSLVVKVVDRFGNPVPGAEVTWTAEVGGSVSPATTVTA